MVAAAIGGAALGGLASSAISGNAAKSAANTQAQAANNATAVQQQNYNRTAGLLSDYSSISSGGNAINTLLSLTGTAPGDTSPATSPLLGAPGFYQDYGGTKPAPALIGNVMV